MPIILRNRIRCRNCGDIIESCYTHDFKTCSCGRVAVDGGHDHLSRSFTSEEDYEELSETVNDDDIGKTAESAREAPSPGDENPARWKLTYPSQRMPLEGFLEMTATHLVGRMTPETKDHVAEHTNLTEKMKHTVCFWASEWGGMTRTDLANIDFGG